MKDQQHAFQALPINLKQLREAASVLQEVSTHNNVEWDFLFYKKMYGDALNKYKRELNE